MTNAISAARKRAVRTSSREIAPKANGTSLTSMPAESVANLGLFVARNPDREKMVRPERFELPTLWFVAKCSIQLSYGRDTLQPAEIRL